MFFKYLIMKKEAVVAQIRLFNRFYTNIIEVLGQNTMDSGLSLSEARVFFEIGQYTPCTAADIKDRINIDEGYISRIVQKFVEKRWLIKQRAEDDKRKMLLTLSPAGQTQLKHLNSLANQAAVQMTMHLHDDEAESLIESMQNITRLLTKNNHERST